jgi:hypothetical protein
LENLMNIQVTSVSKKEQALSKARSAIYVITRACKRCWPNFMAHGRHSNSAPVMDDLHQWLKNRFAEHKTEPNSGLGKAISYLLRHWPELTLCWRQAGAPLDNNIAERMLKKAILRRKNPLFCKTMNGARVGDLFMSLIHTCELNKVNPFDYLTALLGHPARNCPVRPAEWMPWNCRRDATAVAAFDTAKPKRFFAQRQEPAKMFRVGCPRTIGRPCPGRGSPGATALMSTPCGPGAPAQPYGKFTGDAVSERLLHSLICSGCLSAGLRQTHQLGADMKSAAVRGSLIDFKPDFAVLHGETDHHSLRSGISSVSHREKARRLLNRENRVDFFVGPGTDEQDMTSTGLPGFGDAADVDGPRADFLAGHHIVQRAAKRVFTQNADREWFSRVPKSFVRPIDELGEVIEKCRFHPILTHRLPYWVGGDNRSLRHNQTHRNDDGIYTAARQTYRVSTHGLRTPRDSGGNPSLRQRPIHLICLVRSLMTPGRTIALL